MITTLLTFDTLDSTNTEALKHARQGAAEGLCITARQQTAGRGRYGRTWVSAKDAGLYFSIILRPKLETQFLPLLTLMAGVAVHDMLREYALNPDIKWVNDIHIEERKIAGILAETAEGPEGLAVVVGIGVNRWEECRLPSGDSSEIGSNEYHVSASRPSRVVPTNKLPPRC